MCRVIFGVTFTGFGFGFGLGFTTGRGFGLGFAWTTGVGFLMIVVVVVVGRGVVFAAMTGGVFVTVGFASSGCDCALRH